MLKTLDGLHFSLPEILSLLGLVQVVYILVYMIFRAGDFRAIVWPFTYFAVLGLAFFFDFAKSFIGSAFNYDLLQWFFWFAGPPLSVLLILHIARLGSLPSLREMAIILLLPAAFLIAFAFASGADCHFPGNCPTLREWLPITGLLAGVVSLASLWPKRFLFHEVLKQKAGAERYWIILTMIIVNLFFLGFTLLTGLTQATALESLLVRNILGIALVYLASTSLFRIYPHSFLAKTEPASAVKHIPLTSDEQAIAVRIRHLIEMEKVYHEPAYSRTDLARELSVSEGAVSRIISHTYGRTFPQLINEHRIEDAKRLLHETDAAIRIVAEEVGFNSLASFNRVFKVLTGQNPTDYRQSNKHVSNQSGENTA